MVVDVIMFNGEYDVLDIRLNVLNDVVDQFIICEANETYTGIPKPYYFLQGQDRYEKFLPKIKFLPLGHYPDDPKLVEVVNNSPGVPQDLHWWRREVYQRESIKNGLTHLKDDDVVFYSDADEIWNPEIPIPEGRGKYRQLVYVYYLDNRSDEEWAGTSLMRYSDIKNDTLDNLRAHDEHRAYMKAPYIDNGGWHFTNIGGADFIKRKLESYSHQEFNHPAVMGQLEERVSKNQDFLGRGFRFWRDESELPEYLKKNRDKYPRLWLPQR